MKKENYLHFRACLTMALASLLLASCVSSTGPVTIRDSSGTTIYNDTQKNSEYGSGEPLEKQTDIAILSPVKPNAKKAAVPIIDRLVNQANEQILAADYKKAIGTAERGLRINRKEPRLYLALAKAYRGLKNTQQSSYFAKQGLRYAQTGSSIFSQLKNMAK